MKNFQYHTQITQSALSIQGPHQASANKKGVDPVESGLAWLVELTGGESKAAVCT